MKRFLFSCMILCTSCLALSWAPEFGGTAESGAGGEWTTDAGCGATVSRAFKLCPLENPEVIEGRSRQWVDENWAKKELRCDWKNVDTANLYFPPDFLWGVGLCDYQANGQENDPDSNWAHWEKQTKDTSFPAAGRFDTEEPTIEDDAQSGKSGDFRHLYAQDIERATHEIGVNSFRTSIEWSLIEPREGEFNQDAIAYYHDMLDKMHENGIFPMITLHHFSHPQWFEARGAFEREENIAYFVRFCKKMFAEYKDKVSLWLTINEPGVLAFQGPLRGKYPHTDSGIGAVGRLMKNLMQAHVEVYRALKSMPGGDAAQIGIVHNIVQYEPYHTEPCNPARWIEEAVTSNANYLFHEPITNFLITKKFEFHYRPFIDITYEVDKNEKIVDFIGLNYYSHALIDIFPPYHESSAYRPGDIPTDMPYGIYAEGLYRAIETVSHIGVPIYITENGLADAKDDRRELWLKQYLYVVSQALKVGYDIRGYYYWSIMDNFEWDMGLYGRRYGLYAVDYATLARTLRPSAHYYIDVIKKFKKSAVS